MTFIEVGDLTPFAEIDQAKAEAMIADAVAMATLAAPCLTTPEFARDEAKTAALKAILRGAILRWHEAGTGVVSQQTAGPFGQTIDTSKPRKAMFWPSEIDQLRGLCADADGDAAFSVDTVPTTGMWHRPWCAVYFSGVYCSCGADIAGEPIYEDA